jgi:hypothetical protein
MRASCMNAEGWCTRLTAAVNTTVVTLTERPPLLPVRSQATLMQFSRCCLMDRCGHAMYGGLSAGVCCLWPL